jgi:hypothetical protein
VSPDLRHILVAAAVLAAAAVASGVLKRAWSDRTSRRPWLIAAGWLLIAVILTAPSLVLGGAQGPFIAMTLISVAALGTVARNVQLRAARARAERSLAPEPSDRPSKAWRGWLRAALAGPIGMVASMGAAIAFVTLTPGDTQTRLIFGGLMVPLLWGGAMAWTLADDKILRAAAVLVGVSIVTFTAAALKGLT